MITKARIRDDLQPADLDWITALRGPAIAALMASGAIQPTLFDETDMAEITHPGYPGERLIACYNPFLAAGGPAPAASCSMPPRPSSPRSTRPPGGPAGRCAARTPSPWPWAR